MKFTPAHQRHTLHEASFDAWIRAYRPDENTPNSTVNYYDQGSVLALVLDLTLIQHQSSLRNVLADLWQKRCLDVQHELAGITEADLIEALEHQAPQVNWQILIQSTVHTPSLPDYEEALKSAGVRIEWTKPTTAQAVAQRFGVRLKERSLVISHVLNGRSAAEAGVHAGDEWVALNGEQLKPSTWTETFSRLDNESHSTYELHFFREGRLRTLTLNRPASLTFHQLRSDASANATQIDIATRWLNTGNQPS